MKNLALLVLVLIAFNLSACRNNDDNHNQVATTPTGYSGYNVMGFPSQFPFCSYGSNYCQTYNPGLYSYSGLSYYGNYPYYSYGCQAGYQVMYLGSAYSGYNYACVNAGSFYNTYFSGYGYSPYYNTAGYYGALQACVVGTNSCGYGYCQPMWGSYYGVCVR